ncbi:DUF4083 domain-containing protein [Mesobacillus zeae]
MYGNTIMAVFPLLTLLFYVAPIIFIIWFLVKFLKIQQEKNIILKSISDKLDKLDR